VNELGWHLYGPDDKRDLDERRCDEAMQILRHMAAVWEGHPGFRDEWKP
jgi:hypothetical protein